MPFISEEKLKKLKEIQEQLEKKDKIDKVTENFFLDKLSEKTQGLLDLNKTYGTQEAYALTFSRYLENDMKAHKEDVLFYDWDEIKKYLTQACLRTEKNAEGYFLSTTFLKYLKRYGFKSRLNKKYGVIKFWKIKK